MWVLPEGDSGVEVCEGVEDDGHVAARFALECVDVQHFAVSADEWASALDDFEWADAEEETGAACPLERRVDEVEAVAQVQIGEDDCGDVAARAGLWRDGRKQLEAV